MFPYFRHRSPYYYLAWAGLYLVLGILALAGGAMLASVIKDLFKGIPWLAWPFLAALWALTIWMPGALLFKLGGWGVLLSALLFFSKVDWFFIVDGGDKHSLVMFARGIFRPFVFFAPALIVSCLWVPYR